MDVVGMIMDFDSGELNFEDALKLFSWMVKTGAAWTFQGTYGRIAADLIANGYLDQEGNIV